MTREEAKAWLSLKVSLYRYMNCTTDFSDADSVRRANTRSEEYVLTGAPNLHRIKEIGNGI